MAAYGVKLGLDHETALRLGNFFGGGIGRMGDTCGAVTGALMVIGLKYGTADTGNKASKVKGYDLSKKFVDEFKARNRSVICRELIGFDIGLKKDLDADAWMIISERCPKFVQDAAEILEEIL
ncbi:MAG: C_GCAxxG_C_C family protein [Nitrospirae bacterium]|nr:C_GCAxxG_C_C family protein [Nitrospirota bacterium]